MDGNIGLDLGRRLSIIDFSSVNDSLLDSFNGLDSGDLLSASFEDLCHDAKTSPEKISEGIELFPVVAEPEVPNQKKKAKSCNLRNSLAWNSAFFTNEGVLDANELAIVSKTSKKAVITGLPVIEEDVSKTPESNTTTGSEYRLLENLEVDLFEDVKASIEKSSNEEDDKTSEVSSCCSRNGQEKVARPPCSSRYGEYFSGQSKTSTPFKKQTSSRPPLHRNPKGVVPRPVLGALRTGDQRSSTKSPILRTQPSPVAHEQRTTPTVRSIRSSTVTGNRSPATIPVKSAHFNSVTSKIMSPPLPSPKKKFLSDSMRKKPEFSHLPQPENSKSKTPVRVSAKKPQPLKSKHIKVLAGPSNFPAISPSSSFDSLSSEASSSTPIADQILMSKLSSNPSSSKSQLKTSTSIHLANKLMNEKGKSESIKRDAIASVRGSISGSSSLSRSSAKVVSRSKVDDSVQFQLKPTGLRMPSPKIGFFDVGKHALRTSKVIPNVLQRNLAMDKVSASLESVKSAGSDIAHETRFLDSEKENRVLA